MLGLYIGSTQFKAGKSLCACSMGVLLQRRGLKVGYMKPVGHSMKLVEEGCGDADALVVQEVLGQEAAPEVLTPLLCPANWNSFILASSKGALKQPDSCREEPEGAECGKLEEVAAAYASIAKGKDLMMVSGSGTFPSAGQFAGANGMALAERLDLRVILVENCEETINSDELLYARRCLGERLAGTILNKLAPSDIPLCAEWLTPYLEGHGVKVLGMIPHDPELNIIRSMNLAYELGGRIVAGNAAASAQGITGFLIGSMQVESFMMHLRSKNACAIVVGGDRTDLQLAALYGGSGNCLVLTGNLGPHELVRSKAEQQGVPIIVVKEDTYVVARRISRILKGQKFNDLEQINRGIGLFERSVNLDKILEAVKE